jgi:DNA processing protein
MHDDRAFWVLLCSATGIGPIRFQRLLQLCGSAEAAWRASDLTLAEAGLERRTIDALKVLRKTSGAAQALAQLQKHNITALTLQDPEYPENLRQVADPPPVLFTRGSLLPQDQLAVALVGTRRATDYGREVATRLAVGLAGAGVTVVSGLAKGIDAIAHAATVRAGGRTIAALGNGLDQIYPPQNAALAQSIVNQGQGALVSEFAPGIPPDAVNFPRRNRIISGLSRLTVVVEAGEPSGALITADFALEQGRDVLAVPGSILSPSSAGTNDLLKQGATPVTGVDDILEALGLVSPADCGRLARHVPELGPIETTVWHALGQQPRHLTALERDLPPLPPGALSATLAVLEVKGLARQAGPMLYTRA